MEAEAFTDNKFGETVRAMLVLLLTASILGFFLTSPFVLKRMLFNLYPAAKERLSDTAARDALSVKGIYAIEDQVLMAVGLRRPQETPFDLLYRVHVLLVLLLLIVLLGLMSLLSALAVSIEEKSLAFKGSGWSIHLTVNTYWDAGVIFFALPAIIFLMAFVAYFRLLQGLAE